MHKMYNYRLEHIETTYYHIETTKRISAKQASEGIQFFNSALYHLKNHIVKHGFSSVDEEINFFKKIKVEPMSRLFYYSDVYACELLMPKIGVSSQLSFLKKKIKRINKFFTKHCDFIQYMEQELTKFDQQYFTREFQVFPILSIIELSYLDPAFFTSHDILWARIKGKYNFIKYLNTLLNEIEHNEQPEQRKISTKSLEWTASKTSLVELIYALQASNAINNGNEDIKAIAQAFEQLFDLTLDNIYKTYSEIKIRKKNKSTFLNKLITRFQDKINSENDLS